MLKAFIDRFYEQTTTAQRDTQQQQVAPFRIIIVKTGNSDPFVLFKVQSQVSIPFLLLYSCRRRRRRRRRKMELKVRSFPFFLPTCDDSTHNRFMRSSMR